MKEIPHNKPNMNGKIGAKCLRWYLCVQLKGLFILFCFAGPQGSVLLQSHRELEYHKVKTTQQLGIDYDTKIIEKTPSSY